MENLKKTLLTGAGIFIAVTLGVALLLYAVVELIVMIFSNATGDTPSGSGAVGYSSIQYTDEDLRHLYTVMIDERRRCNRRAMELCCIMRT